MSGGEPTMHAEFSLALFRKLKQVNVHTAMETCGFCQNNTIRKLAEYTDLFLYDFKACTESVHQEWTGQSNRLIKENLRILHDMGKQIIIRIPLIPGVNDNEEFEHMLQFLRQFHRLKQIHIMPFHQIGASKYTLSAMPYELVDMPECDAEYAEKHAELARKAGFDVNIGGWDS